MASNKPKGKGAKVLRLLPSTSQTGSDAKHKRRDSLLSASPMPFSPTLGDRPATASYSTAFGRLPPQTASDIFYRLVVSKPPLDFSSLANVHKLLLQDSTSIASVLKDENTLQPFILNFQEETRSIVDFYNKLRPFFSKNPTQNVGLVKALLEDLVLPLFDEQYLDILEHEEMLQLITVAVQCYYECGNSSSPGLFAQLAAKLVLFPQTKLLERFVSHPESGELFVAIVKDQKFGSSLFEHTHDVLVEWIARLIELSNCGFDHGITASIEQWNAIITLQGTYPQRTDPSLPSKGFHAQNRVGNSHLRKLTDKDKKSGAKQQANKAESQPLLVPPATAQLFQQLNTPLPKNLIAARNVVDNLYHTRAFPVFQAIVASFPCSNCCKSRHRGSSVAVPYSGKYQGQADAAVTIAEIGESRTHGTELYRKELKHLGLWRIVLSRQAMKDFSDARKSGQFPAIENKLRELATGNWSSRKALTKKHINPDFPIPIKKAVYDDNGRIIWHVYLSYDEMISRATQVILVWRIGDHKDVVQSEKVITRHQKTFSKEFVEACKLRIADPVKGTMLPQSFRTSLLEHENITDTLTREESLDLHNAIITGKFYTLTQTVLEGILTSGSTAEFPFDVAHDEVEIIRQTSAASFILGRSGTGKTTCLAFKLLSNYIGSKADAERGLSDSPPIRQIFLTRSEILASKLNGYIRRLINCQLGRFDSDEVDTLGMEVLKEKDEDAEARDFWSLTDDHFPLVCTFNKLLTMVEMSIKTGGRKYWEPQVADTTAPRGDQPSRAPREVDAQTFIEHYWPKFPPNIKKNIPVDLVFSEIMGIIKGSMSALPGRSLNALTKDEYIDTSCRIAPLFTSEKERKQVYLIYEQYEKLKIEFRDWDGIDRTRSVFLQMQENPVLVSKLRQIIDELYVDEIQDQRLLEIELLLTLVRYPRGVHLAGDSAQCISRDSTFRFSDIKSLFFDVFDGTASAMNQSSLAKPREFRLAHNYRSHQGIIALGAWLIESLWNGFPDMIDKLQPEIGKYTGPKPTVFAGFKAEDILVNQSFGLVDLYDQLADFGADQVILVRDEDVQKEVHGRVGSEVLILTVLQSKGMEFEDVVVLNFFSASGYATSYRALDRLIDKKCGDFDRKKHSVLCAELKTLYVAVTRCRANLRIVEEDLSIAELIVDLWTQKVPKPLIDTVRPNDANAAEKIKALRSGSSGNPALWLKNGQHLMEKKLYKQALFCFMKTPYKQRQIHARAHLCRQEAEALALQKAGKHEIWKIYRESAKLFLEAEHPLEASKALEAAGLFEEAAEMWLQRDRPDKAAPLYERVNKFSKASKAYHTASMYPEATKSLRNGKLYEELVDYLESVKNILDPLLFQRSSKLCNLLAHQGKLNPIYKARTLKLLGSDLKIEMFYRQRGYTKELLELFQSRGRVKDGFFYLTSIGRVKDAVLLAPFSQLEACIPRRELLRMQQLLLISDLRATKDGEPPVYADPNSPDGRPGMDVLWDALYRTLQTFTREQKLRKPSDIEIDGFVATEPYVDIIVLERIYQVLQKVRYEDMLPTRSVEYGLKLLRDLYFARQEVPDTLRRFVGAYRQPNRTSLLMLSTSLLNQGDKFYRQMSQEELLQICLKWFGPLVINASWANLEKAIAFWNSMRSSNQCLYFALTGHCNQTGTQWDRPCLHNHNAMPSHGYKSLLKVIHRHALITSQLRFFYSNPQLRDQGVLPDAFYKDFRPRQRRWLESLLTELTYISAVQQDPLLIHSAPIFHTHDEVHKVYRWVAEDAMRLLEYIHAKDEWNTRCSFSEMLELTERSQRFGPRTSKSIRLALAGNVRNALGRARWDSNRLDSNVSRHAALRLFRDRPRIERGYCRNHEPHHLESYFRSVSLLEMKELSALHSVLSHFERIATFLLFQVGDNDEFLLLSSWIEVHLPQVGLAYLRELRINTNVQQYPGLLEAARARAPRTGVCITLIRLTQTLMGILQKVMEDNTTRFKLSGERGLDVSKKLLVRRAFDIICVCVVNLQTSTVVPGDWHSAIWPNLFMALPNIAAYAGVAWPGAFSNRNQYIPKETFFRWFASCMTVYDGKEGLTLVQAKKDSSRFAGYRSFPEVKLHTVGLEEVDPATRVTSPALTRVDAPEESEEQQFTKEELAAAHKIYQIWKKYWPRYVARREWRITSLGRATTVIDNLCQRYQPAFNDLCILCQELYHVFWLRGPKTYEAIKTAEAQGAETSEYYQAFFTSLYGSSYTDADLERVEELFEEVEKHTSTIAEMKEVFSLDGMAQLWMRYLDHDDLDEAGNALRDDLITMQKEASSITHAFTTLGRNRYVDAVRDN